MAAPIPPILKCLIVHNFLNFPPILFKFVSKFMVCKVFYFEAQYALRLRSPLNEEDPFARFGIFGMEPVQIGVLKNNRRSISVAFKTFFKNEPMYMFSIKDSFKEYKKARRVTILKYKNRMSWHFVWIMEI